jgi:RNA polymerase sigma-70 factor (ECF subfamily)
MTTQTAASLAVDIQGDLRKATDDVLTLAARSGNGLAFVELSRRHSRRIQLHAYRILGNWEDAEDVVQDSLLRAYKHLDQFRGKCSFKTWLSRIAINSALMELRKRRARPDIACVRATDLIGPLELWEFPDHSPSPERLCASREMDVMLRGAILRLPWRYQTVTDMYHAKECSTIEIARDLGISAAAVKSRLYRARRTLRASLPHLGLSV